MSKGRRMAWRDSTTEGISHDGTRQVWAEAVCLELQELWPEKYVGTTGNGKVKSVSKAHWWFGDVTQVL